MRAIATRARHRSIRAALIVSCIHLGCNSPATPSKDTVVSRIDIGAAAGGGSVAPGGSLQLNASATYADGSQRDVTDTAVWQSSDPKTAVVTSTGMVKGGQTGTADISAILGGATGKTSIQVKLPAPSCSAATLSANSASVTPFKNVVRINVVTPLSDCRWTAASDASWLNPGDQSLWESGSGSLYDPGRSGDGGFSYTAFANRTVAVRTGRIRVTFTDGTELVYALTQAAPTCAIIISPGERTAPYTATSGSFEVHVTPSTCTWTAWIDPRISPVWNLQASGGGTGDGAISYSANPMAANLSSIGFWIHAVPSNPLDPPARFHLSLGGQ